jgi:hypothetical protein
MPVTKMAVVYSLDQSRVRRIVYPDDDADLLNRPVECLPGEAVEIMDLAVDIDFINIQISKLTGRPIKDDRYFVVDDKGKVIESFLMDPTIDDTAKLAVPLTAQLVAKDVLESTVQEIKAQVLAAETVTLQKGG